MRRWIKPWVTRLLVDTSIEVKKLEEITQEIREWNDQREKVVADLNDTDQYWLCGGAACGIDDRDKK